MNSVPMEFEGVSYRVWALGNGRFAVGMSEDLAEAGLARFDHTHDVWDKRPSWVPNGAAFGGAVYAAAHTEPT